MGDRLLKFATDGNLAKVKMVLDQGVDVNHKDINENTALMNAAYGHLEVVRELLDRGADPNIRNVNGITPLYPAARDGHLEVVRELLNRGADPNIVGIRGWIPLVTASKENHLEIVKELLDHGANPNLSEERDGNTALMSAAKNNNLEMVKVLLDRGADPNLQNNHGMTALTYVGPTKRPDLVNLIEKYSIDPTIIDPNTGISNLEILAANGPIGLLRRMIDKNPALNLNQQDQDGNTPLIYAIVNRQKENVDLLLDRGADPNLANNGGGTPLAYAVQLNQKEIEQMLIDAGAQ